MRARVWRRIAGCGLVLSLGGMVALAATADGRIVDNAVRALADGSPDRALAVLAAGGLDDPRIHHVRGSALLRLGEARAATEELAAAAAKAEDPSLRRRALHNLSVAHLELTGAGPVGERRLHARAAAAAARDALRLQWDAPGTRWNLALALRVAPPNGEDSGVGTPDRPSPRPGSSEGSGTGDLAPGDPSQQGLTPEQARRILDGLMDEGDDALSAELASLLNARTSPSGRRGPPW